jgi:hypothetical protein
MDSPEKPPTKGKGEFSCPRCPAAYLSEEALERHYEWNPGHAETVVLDARELESEGEKLAGSEWVELDDRVETFLTVPGDVDERSLEMTYRPGEGALIVEGALERRIDVSDVQERASDRFRWSFDGTYHRIAFLKSATSE